MAPLEIGAVAGEAEVETEVGEEVDAGEDKEVVAAGWRGWTRKLFCNEL